MNALFRKTLVIFFSYLVSTSFSFSSPWAAVGDMSLRNDVEILATHGLISGPVNTWPMSWKQITRNFHKADSMELPSFVRHALMRVREKTPKEFNIGLRAQITNNPTVARSFENTARNDFDTSASIEYNGESGTTIHVEGGYRYGNGEEYSHIDESYISQDIGNWATYAGAFDRWWGPGRESTLILSNNARPMPSIGLRRIEAKPFESKWLKWIGPWQWDMFLAKMEKDRHIENPLFVGMRLSFEPMNNFDIGLSRTLQVCGKGRACGFNSWTKALIAIGDLDNPVDRTDLSQEPGNQLASIDLSYSMKINNKTSIKLYAEGTAEDLLVFLPYEYAKLAGASISGPTNNGGLWKISTEFSDTISTLVWFGGRRKEGVHYNHHIYQTGHRYKGRVLGNNLDYDSQLLSLSAELSDKNNWRFKIKYQHALININGDKFYPSSSSSNEETINIVEFSANTGFEFGDVGIILRLADNDPNTLNENKTGIDFSFSWSKSY